MDNMKIFLSVSHYIDQYGPNASVQAARTADRLLALGDLDGFKLWMQIGRAIEGKQVTAARRYGGFAD